jgi:hypothetical protein
MVEVASELGPLDELEMDRSFAKLEELRKTITSGLNFTEISGLKFAVCWRSLPRHACMPERCRLIVVVAKCLRTSLSVAEFGRGGVRFARW